MKFETYQDILEVAQALRLEQTAPKLAEAETLLREGMKRHRYALPLGDELVLVLEKQHKDEEALKLLNELEDFFKNSGVETLCRFGKLFKKQAEKAKKAGVAAAIPLWSEAERYYRQAYEKNYGYYPRINQLSCRYIRAGLLMTLGKADGNKEPDKLLIQEANQLVNQTKVEAQEMLNNPQLWQQHNADDAIWIAATQGEAYILLGDWEKATTAYQQALDKSQGKNYGNYMSPQVKLLLEANNDLGIPSSGPLTDPDTFFNVMPSS